MAIKLNLHPVQRFIGQTNPKSFLSKNGISHLKQSIATRLVNTGENAAKNFITSKINAEENVAKNFITSKINAEENIARNFIETKINNNKITSVFNDIVSKNNNRINSIVNKISNTIHMPNIQEINKIHFNQNHSTVTNPSGFNKIHSNQTYSNTTAGGFNKPNTTESNKINSHQNHSSIISSSNSYCYQNPFLASDPNITGVFFVFISFPLDLEYRSKASNLCGFLAKSYSPPSQSISVSTRKGIGNTQLTIPKSHDYERQFSVTFLDTYELAIYQIFKTWFNYIIDARSGFHGYGTLSDIKGSAVVIHYTPSMKKTVHVDTYLGVFPISLPALDEDRSNVTIRETQITFAFDSI